VGILGVGVRTTFTELPGDSIEISRQGNIGVFARGVGKGEEIDYTAVYFE